MDVDSVAGLVVPSGAANLLLPNAAVAEIVAYRPPAAVEGAPAWLLGTLDWRDRLVPAVSIAAAGANPAEVKPGHRARLVVCFTPSGNQALPYMALLATAAPRLARFHEQSLVPDPDAAEPQDNPFVLHALRYMDQPGWIPDMDALERAVLEAKPA
jgi:chemosensory pili system protein ChpC